MGSIYVNGNTFTVDGAQGSYGIGDDTTGNGSLAAPYKTIRKAVSVASIGDNIFIAPADYNEAYNTAYGIRMFNACNLRADASGDVNMMATGASSATVFLNGNGDVVIDGVNFPNVGNRNMIYDYNRTSGLLKLSNSSISQAQASGETKQLIRVGSDISFEMSDCNLDLGSIRGPIVYTDVKTGAINLFRNVIDIDAVYNVNLIYLYNGAWDFETLSNVVTITDASGSTPGYAVYRLRNQVTPVISGDIIDILSEAGGIDACNLDSTGTDCGVITISECDWRTRALAGYIAHIGTETSTAGDNMFDAVITGSKFRGPAYFDRSKSSAVGFGLHGVFIGYNSNPIIERNLIGGAFLGAVLKGNGNPHASGITAFNRFVDNVQDVHVKGVAGPRIINNSARKRHSSAGFFVSVIDNDSYSPINIKIKGNAVDHNKQAFVSNASSALTGFECESNGGAGVSEESFGYVWGVVKTKTEWQALGYDADFAEGTSISDDDDMRITSPASHLTHSAPTVAGVNDGAQTDPWGNTMLAYPNIGADQFDYAPGFGPWSTCGSSLPTDGQVFKSHAAPIAAKKVTVFPGVASAGQISEAKE